MEKDTLIIYINQGLSTWKIAKVCSTTQPNIRYWLNKYELKTLRTLNKHNTDRTCLTCNITKPKEEFYKKGKKFISHCKPCYQQTYTERCRINKQLAVDYLGGKCSNCGYNKSNAALDFHHLDPNTKELGLAQAMKTSFDKIKYELDKCVLLCANCHREHPHLNNI